MEWEELAEALDGLYAYDTGCTDSGIHDPRLKKKIRDYLKTLDEKQVTKLIARFMRERCLSDEMIDEGYGPEDATHFFEWFQDEHFT
jgi:hypothetical protein